MLNVSMGGAATLAPGPLGSTRREKIWDRRYAFQGEKYEKKSMDAQRK